MANIDGINVTACEKSPTDSSGRESMPFYFSWRMLTILTVFLGVNLNAIMRSMVGITMVCMVNSTAGAFSVRNATKLQYDTGGFGEFGNESAEPECSPSDEIMDEYQHGQFDWSNMQQGYVFAGVAWGQLVTIIPAGLCSDTYSIRKIIFISFFTGAICTSLVPFVAPMGYAYLTLLRVFSGLSVGAVVPCFGALVAHWVPALEIGTMYAIVTAGNQLGIVLFMPFSTYLCQQRHLFGGWPLAYYSIGALTFAWCVVWWFLVTDYPDQHRYVSKAEVSYIVHGRKPRVTKATRKDFKRPYRHLLFSPASLACVACFTTATWGFACLVLYLPMYFRDVMFLDLRTNGEVSALPFLCQFVCKLLFSRLADRMKQMGMNATWIVKGFNTIGMFSIACFLFGMTFLNCNQSSLAVLLSCLAMGLHSSISPGFVASGLLIAPRHAGLQVAWANFVATCAQLALPYVVGAVVVDSTASEWRLVFAIGSTGQVLSGVVFLIWGSGEEQPWAKVDHRPQGVSFGASSKGSRPEVCLSGTTFQHTGVDRANASQMKDEST